MHSLFILEAFYYSIKTQYPPPARTMEVSDAVIHQPSPTSVQERGEEIVETLNPHLKTPRLPVTHSFEETLEYGEEK